MKNFRVLAVALAASAMLAACGGSGPGDQTPRVTYGKMVNFGDSLSDVGTYATKLVAANGEGHYSINGDLSADGIPHTNWTEFLAASLDLAQPCAAEVGLQSVGQLAFMAQAVVDNASCYSYAQGGAMVTFPYGPSNAFYYTQLGLASGQLGQITKPIAAQVASHLQAHTSFAADDLITVMGGGNDVFINRAQVDATVAAVAAAGAIGTDAGNQQIATAATNAVTAMTAAGTQLATLITSQVIGNGGTHVLAVNLPDVSLTPDQHEWLIGPTGAVIEAIHPHLTSDMVIAFNTALAAGLGVTAGVSTHAEVLYIDAYAGSQAQSAMPAQFGLTNVTTPACDLTKTGVAVPGPAFVPLASSLFCTKSMLITDTANVTPTDPSGVLNYEFADNVHPTPYAYRLLSQLVTQQMAINGWL
jgi:phospholipase/lecithinase/hemolysin